MATTAATQPTTTGTKTKAPENTTQVAKKARADTYPLDAGFLKFITITTKAEMIHPPNNVIFICHREDKLVDVWKGLIKHEFWSCPVLQKTGNKWYGFIDLMDIVNYIVELFGRQKLETDQDFFEAYAKEEILQSKTVRDVMKYPLSRKDPFHPIKQGFSLFAAIELLAKEKGFHRVPVIDSIEKRQLINILTQSQIIDFLMRNVNSLGVAKDKPIRLVEGAQKTVIKINQSEPAIEAFKLMRFNEVTGVAVINDAGQLVGAISQSDLKLIQADGRMFWRLYQPIKNFLQKSRKEGYERPTHPITADPAETIQTTLKKFQDFHVHRIFIVDDNMKPTGIVALKDILNEIITE